MTTIFFDTETHAIARGKLAPKLVCVQAKRLGVHPAQIWRRRDALPAVVRMLRGNHVLVGVNVAYDMGVICARWARLIPLVFAKYSRGQVLDLAVIQKIVDVAYGVSVGKDYSAEGLAARYGVQLNKSTTWRLRFGELDGTHPDDYPDEARDYALDDVRLDAIWDGIQEQAARFERRTKTPCLHIAADKSRAAWALHLKSCWGVHTDEGRVALFRGLVDAQHARLKARLQRATIRVHCPADKKWGRRERGIRIGADGWYRTPFVRSDGSAVVLAATTYMERLAIKRRFKAKLSDSGGVSTDADSAARSGSGVLLAFCAYRTAKKRVARCGDLAAGHELPLQARWNPMLITGRTSCSKPADDSRLRGTQLQNPDKAVGVRECFTPCHPDWVFFDADLPSAELHSLAQCQMTWFGRSKLGDLLNEGKNVLLWFGATVLHGIPYPEAERRLKAGDKAIKEMRQGAKAPIYGYPGGLGAEKMVVYARTNYGQHITIETSQRWKEAWMDALQMGPYFHKINSCISERTGKGYLRAPVSGMWRGGAYFTELANYPFQSLTAFGATAGDFETSRECYAVPDSPLYGCRPWAFVHDQILCQGPRAVAPEAAERLAEVMTEQYNCWVPDVPIRPGKTEPCVMEVWSKSAQTVRDQTGRLRPWSWRDALAAAIREKKHLQSPDKLVTNMRLLGAPPGLSLKELSSHD